MIDSKRLNLITGGNRETEKKLLNLFISSSGSTFKRMTDASIAGDIKELKAAIHELKGASANMGLEGLYQICLNAEKLDLNDKQAKDTVLETIKIELDKFISFVSSNYPNFMN